jgi:DNA polymerase
MNFDIYLEMLGITRYKLKSNNLDHHNDSNINNSSQKLEVEETHNSNSLIPSLPKKNNIIITINTANHLEDLDKLVNSCTKCNLCKNRKQAILGKYANIDLSINVDCLVVGEAPKDFEDELNLPFAGEVDVLLTKMLQSINLHNTYITNVVKCKTNFEKPNFEQLSHCEPYLFKQISILKPKAILALGKIATQTLISPTASLADVHGKIYDLYGTKVIATYHPRYLLANPEYKRKVWGDLLALKSLLSQN